MKESIQSGGAQAKVHPRWGVWWIPQWLKEKVWRMSHLAYLVRDELVKHAGGKENRRDGADKSRDHHMS